MTDAHMNNIFFYFYRAVYLCVIILIKLLLLQFQLLLYVTDNYQKERILNGV